MPKFLCRVGMADNTRKSKDERENTVGDKNEATSNVTATNRDQRGGDVGEGVGESANPTTLFVLLLKKLG